MLIATSIIGIIGPDLLLYRIDIKSVAIMLRDYESFLTRKGNVKPLNIPYYVKWVSDCYRFLNESESERLSSDQKGQFLSRMAKNHEDWQVKQADTALRLYDYFLSRKEMQASKASSADGLEWSSMEDKLRQALRLHQRSLSTEKTYVIWVRNFRRFVGEKSPEHLQGRDLQDFLSHLAVEKRISPSTQNQALNAVLFFFRHVLDKNVDQELRAVRAKYRRHLPVVLSQREVQSIFGHLEGASKLMA